MPPHNTTYGVSMRWYIRCLVCDYALGFGMMFDLVIIKGIIRPKGGVPTFTYIYTPSNNSTKSRPHVTPKVIKMLLKVLKGHFNEV